MTNRENFIKAIYRDKPDHVPINGGYCYGKFDEESECKVIHYRIKDEEWGYCYSRAGGDNKTMGIVTEHPLRNNDEIAGWLPPEIENKNRFEGIAEKVKELKEKDLIVFGGIGSFIFERMHYLVGMENVFELMYDEPELFKSFTDKITNYNCKIISEFSKTGVDGIWGGDDWGLQDRLMISPAMWRTFFKPCYSKFFQTIKSYEMISYMHSCGKNNEIIADLIECGLDVIEIHQPNVYGIDWLSANAGGKICFSTTPDIQKTLPLNDTQKIVNEIFELKEKLGLFYGGLLYNFYGNPEAINIPPENMELYLTKAKQIGEY